MPLQSVNSSLIIINDWPESEIEDIAYVSCPCGYMTFDSGEELQTSRLCSSNATNGTQREMAYLSSCNFIDGALSICQIAIVRLVAFILIACICHFSTLPSEFRCVFFSLSISFVGRC